MSAQSSSQPRVPVSIGELIDKITILEIKGERIAHRDKVANIVKELALLRAIQVKAGLDSTAIDGLAHELRTVMPWISPGMVTSSTYRARPVTLACASFRRTG